MRQETREYNFDWMLWSCFSLASQLAGGTEKEYRNVLKYIPYFRGAMEKLLDSGEPGRRFIGITASYLDNIINARERGKKTAMTTFCFSPALLYAMDVVPVGLEVITVMMTLIYRRGTAEFLDFCNEAGFTETSCSSQRGALGGYIGGIGAPIDMIVTDTPGVCDTNANAFAFASAYMKIPFFSLDMPPDLTGSRSDRFHRDDYRALIAFLEEQTGKKLDMDRLREVLLEVQKQDEIIADLEELARIIPNPLPPVFNFMIYASRFLYAGMPECTGLLESMRSASLLNVEKGLSGLAGGVENLRALFCYIAHYSPNLDLWRMCDEYGITTQGNILSRSWAACAPHVKEFGTEEAAYTLDTGGLDALIDSMAMMNARMPMVKSIRGPYDAPDMWLQDNLSLAAMYSADLIVYNGTPGCRNTWGMVKLMARDTQEAGYPTYIMYADAFDERVQSWETTKERFLEFLNVRRLMR
jgi:hypothetical protein